MESVIVDCRLPYVELLQLEGPSEILFFRHAVSRAIPRDLRIPEHGGTVAVLLKDRAQLLDRVGSRIHVPPVSQVETMETADALVLHEDWWLGLRQALDENLRRFLRFDELCKRLFRVFVLPMPSDSTARCILTTDWLQIQEQIISKKIDPVYGMNLCEDRGVFAVLRSIVAGPPAGLCPPSLPAHVIESGHVDGWESDVSIHTRAGMFPHQCTTLQWMHESEAYERTVELCPPVEVYPGRMLCRDGYDRGAKDLDKHYPKSMAVLPSGGIIAHPVGSGKSVITAKFLEERVDLDRPRDLTLVVVPSHVIHQWNEELGRHAPSRGVKVVNIGGVVSAVPGLEASVSVLLVAFDCLSHGRFQSSLQSLRIVRVIIDEPQELTAARSGPLVDAYEFLVSRLPDCRFRWLLTATPWEYLRWLASIVFGLQLTQWAFRTWRAVFVEHCMRCDPAWACLPVPQAHSWMVPVTLAMEEAQMVRAMDMTRNLMASALACSMHWQLQQMYSELSAGGLLEEALEDSTGDPFQIADVGVAAAFAEATHHHQRTFERTSLQSWFANNVRHYENLLEKIQDELRRLREKLDAAERRHRDTPQLVRRALADLRQEFEDWMNKEDEAMRDRVLLQLRSQVVIDLARRLELEQLISRLKDVREKHLDAAAVECLSQEISSLKDEGDHLRVRVEQELSRYDRTLREMYPDPSVLARALSILQSSHCTFWQTDSAAQRELFDENVGMDEKAVSRMMELERQLSEVGRVLDFVKHVQNAVHQENLECPVCLDPLRGKRVVVLNCLHIFDEMCVLRLIEGVEVLCPICRAVTRRRDFNTFLFSRIQTGHDVTMQDTESPAVLQCAAHPEQTGASESSAPAADSRISAYTSGCFHYGIPVESSAVERSKKKKAGASGLSTDLSLEVPVSWMNQTDRSHFGTKISCLLAMVRRLLSATTDEKVVVFAQQNSLIRAVSWALEHNGIAHLSLVGSAAERVRSLKIFSDPQSFERVLLLSHSQHASGVNLHVANHVFVMHPFINVHMMNAALIPLSEAQEFERQAVGRVHRYPQKRPVHVYRLYSRGTIEEELYATWGWS